MNDHTPHLQDDVTIALQIMERDEAGLRVLLQVHGAKVRGWLRQHYRGVLSSEEADSVLYAASFNAWQRIAQFDDSQAPLGAWFFAIARNAAIDYLRQSNRQGLDLIEDPAQFADPWSEAEDCNDDPKLKKLAAAMDQIIEHSLSTQQREIILADMAAEGQADNQWLAEKLGTTTAAVHTARSKAHKRIREELEKRGLAPTEGVADEPSCR